MSFNYDQWKKYTRRAKYTLGGAALLNVPGAVGGYYLAKSTEPPEKSYPTPEKTPKKKMGSYGVKRKAVPQFVWNGKEMASKKKKTMKATASNFRLKKAFSKVQKVAGKRRASRLRKVRGTVTGGNGGKFKYPSKSGFKKQMKLTKVLREGYNLVYEQHGSVLDSDCVYIQHSNFRPTKISLVLTGALFRKLFRKAGIEIDNMDTELPLVDHGNSDGFKIIFTVKNPLDGTYTSTEYLIEDNKTFGQIVTQQTSTGLMRNYIEEYCKNTNSKEPYRLSLYQSDRNGLSTNWRLASDLNLENEKIHISMKSRMTIQNRTLGSGAPAADAVDNRVDNQPLKGLIYEFKNADPRLRSSQLKGTGVTDNRDYLYNTADFDRGVRTYGGTQIPGPNGLIMREPPAAKIWKNISGVSSVSLEPGMMKSVSISSQYENYMLALLKRFRADSIKDNFQTMDTLYRNVSSCKSQIIALEEVLRTPADNAIICAYENEWRCGAYCVTKKKKGVLLSDFQIGSADGVPQYVPPA
jgi:hypothetical protein